MGVHRHGGHAQREAQDDRRRLGADAVELLEPGLGLVQRQVFEEAEVQRAALPDNLVKDGLDARRFDFRQPAYVDGLGDLLDVARGHGVQGAEGLHEPVEGALGVQVGCMLGEHGEHQLLHRLVPRLPDYGAVLLAPQLQNVGSRYSGLASALT